MASKDLVRELIGDYSAERFVRVLKMACAPASYVSVGVEHAFRELDSAKVNVLGVVKDLRDEKGLIAPLLVADIPLSTTLSERSSRIRQFKLAKKVLEHFAATPPLELDGVIAQGVFVFHDEEGRFRVSLVTATPENGKFNWSKARRQSFYVTNDPDANATFVQRMCMDWSSLKGINEAFSVEKLTKEFYSLLFAWYERACDDERVEYPNGLDTDADNREDKNRKHIIRLITRLMFVWFLKQKGLVPDSLFDEHELLRILKNFNPTDHKQHQYYRAILQNLFFATLNSEIDERGFADTPGSRHPGEKPTTRHHGVKTKYRYADEFAISRQKVLDLFRPIPFLNGGLFECLDQEGEDGRVMYYDGFSQQERHRDFGTLTWAHVPNDLFFDPDYGIIPLLRRYNFTVEENSPGDEDVALDPELLGKVFENLLGAYNEEIQKSTRNSTGSFYTPREIVNYMVDESLIAHLTTSGGSRIPRDRDGRAVSTKPPIAAASSMPPYQAYESTIRALVTDGVRPSDDALCERLAEAIENAKILDPACGSGAFPMGALLKMVELLRILKKLPEGANLYDLKLRLIENCIFGSDIQEIAVQISKLRIFISLVCEQKPDMTKPNYGINTLPNLETKFVAANSLIGLQKEKQKDLFFDSGEIQGTKDALWDVRHRHFTAKTRREKNKLRNEDRKLREKLAAAAKELGYSEESTRLMASWDPYNQNVHAEFFDPEWMFNVKDGFDIVIGNPPYVQMPKGLYSAVTFPFSEGKDKGKQNLYKVFIEAGYNLVKQNGSVSFIVQSSLMGDMSAKYTRELLLTKTQIAKIIEFPKNAPTPVGKVFKSVLQGTCIVEFKKETPSADQDFEISILNDITTVGRFAFEKIRQADVMRFYPEHYEFPLIKSGWATVVAKIKNVGHVVKEYLIDTAQGNINTIHLPRILSNIPTGAVIAKGIHIHRWKLDEQLFHCIVSAETKRLFEINEGKCMILSQNISGTTDKHRINAAPYECKNTRIVFLHSANVLYLRSPREMRFVTAVLNSELMDWIFRITSTNNHLNMYELETLPIPLVEPAQQVPIVAIVDRILEAKKRNPAADTSALEREIDKLVYQLYGLTDDEIRVIDPEYGRDGAAAAQGGGRGAPALPSGHAGCMTLPGDGRARSPNAPKNGGMKKRKPKIEEEF